MRDDVPLARRIAHAAPARLDGRRFSGIWPLRVRSTLSKPGPRVYRMPVAPNLEIQLGLRAPPAVPGGGDDLSGGDRIAGGLVEALIMSIKAQVTLAVVDDFEQSQTREPIGIDHAPGGNGLDGRSALGRKPESVPFHAGGTGVAEGGRDVTAHRPGQLPSQPPERARGVGRGHRLERSIELAEQFLQIGLLALEPG